MWPSNPTTPSAIVIRLASTEIVGKTKRISKIKRETQKQFFFFAPFCATCLSERVTTYWRAISKGPTSAKVNGSSQQRISEKSLLASASHQLTRLIVTRPLLTWGGGGRFNELLGSSGREAERQKNGGTRWRIQ